MTATLDALRTDGRTLTFANDRIEIVLSWSDHAPVRVARLGAPGAAPALPSAQPLVEVATVASGRAPVANRLAGGIAGSHLRYVAHQVVEDGDLRTLVVTQDDAAAGLRAESRLELRRGIAAVRARVTVSRDAQATGRCQLVTVAPLALALAVGNSAEADPAALLLHSADSQWVGESQWSSVPMREAGLPQLSLAVHETGARGCIAQSSRGLWSTARSMPVGALSATGDGAALAWQIESTAGWRWEIGEHRDGAYLALSGPCDVDQDWCVPLDAGAAHESPWAAIALGEDVDSAFGELTGLRRATRRPHPDGRRLRVVYNDYMNTLMGDPHTERLIPLIENAAAVGAEVFCIDAGWYDDTAGWWQSVGEWQPSTVRFPGGLQEVLDRIARRGMVPGIWLEPEAVGVDSRMTEVFPDEAFMCRGGERIVEQGRLHLDFRHPAVRAHLDDAVDRLVGMGVGYFKLDHNTNPVLGTDTDGGNPAAALVGHARAYREWLAGVLDRHPDLVLETCSSGAMRADLELLNLAQLQSTSDQQDPIVYPPIAASAPLAMLPEAAGSWAYPQPSMTDEEIAFTLCTGMLGRLYLSGFVDGMSTAQRSLVAEGVAAHKRLRADVARGVPRWPLGLDQWREPWVAAAIELPSTTYLTLWHREDAAATLDVPMPSLRGEDVTVDVVFPARLDGWTTAWDRDAGVLRVSRDRADGAPVSARTLRLTVGEPVQQIEVDASASTGAVHGGATGMLYGLAEPGVPTAALIEGARPLSIAQKLPRGLQHPGGDADAVAGDFLAAGGRDIHVYVQDALTRWPYEEIGIEPYLDILRDAVRTVVDRPDRESYVWVPFNEPDWIWYADWSDAGRARFLADWDAAVATIRDVDPDARIAGPNEAFYHPHRMRDFLAHAREHGTVPDVITWHELEPLTLEAYPWHHAHVRGLERELGIDPRPVCINEYGNRRDMSVPGQLLQWIDNFESTKVDADLAYWTLAGNLDDHAVDGAYPNAGWWMLQWYASLRGETVTTVVPHRGVRDSARALAAVAGRTTTAIVAGAGDAVDLTFRALPVLGDTRVLVERLDWSGYQGACLAPRVTSDASAHVGADGSLVVRIPAAPASTAFRVTVSPDGGGEPAPASPWSATIGAHEARVQRVDVLRHGEDPQHYHRTGPWSVRAMPSADSRVDFDVTVPQAGAYRLSLGYGTEGAPGRVALDVDGEVRVVELPATLERSYTGRAAVEAILEAGPHTIRVSTRGADGQHLTRSDVSIDHLAVTAVDTARQRLEAVLARPSSACESVSDGARWGRGALRMEEGASARFAVVAPEPGLYSIVIAQHGDGAVALAVDGGRIPLYPGALGSTAVCALPGGAVTIDVIAAGPVTLDGIEVRPATSAEPAVDVDAASLTLVGAAELRSAGSAGLVTGLEAGGAVTVDLGSLRGELLVAVTGSNAYRLSGHEYNTDAVVRTLALGAGAGTARLAFPHTVHWDSTVRMCAVVDATAPTLEIRAGDVDGPAVQIARVEVFVRQLPSTDIARSGEVAPG